MAGLTISTELLLTIIFCVIDIVIYVPIQYYSIVKFSCIVNRNTAKQQIGYPQLVIGINILAILFTSIVHPQIIIISISPIDTLFPSLHQTFATITHFEAIFVVDGLLVLAGARYWLLYFDLNIINSIINGQWKLYINSTCVETDFWFRHRNKWKNNKYIFKCFTIVYIVICIIHCSLILIFFDDKEENTMDKLNSCLWSIPVVFLTTIYLKTPRISNKNQVFILLKYEAKTIGIWIAIQSVVILIVLNIHIDTDFIMAQKLLHHASYGLSVVSACLLAMHSTLHVQQNHFYRHGQKYSQIRNSNAINQYTEKTLRQIFCDEEELEVFIQYLCMESQLNTFLCFSELIQFKYLMDKVFDITLNRRKFTLGTILEDELIQNEIEVNEDYYESCILSIICDSTIIPKSDIVYSDENMFNFNAQKSESLRKYNRIAHDLYCKYIADKNHGNSDRIREKLTVELPCTLRKCYDFDMDMSPTKYVEKHPADTFEDLFEYFDPIIVEMWQKLHDMQSS